MKNLCFFFKTEHDPQPCSEIHGQMTEGIFNIFEDKIFFPIFQNYLYKNQIFSKNHPFFLPSTLNDWAINLFLLSTLVQIRNHKASKNSFHMFTQI